MANREPKFQRDTSRKGDLPAALVKPAADGQPVTAAVAAAPPQGSTAAGIGSGRDFRYEWEAYLAEVLGRVETLEAAPGGPASSGVFAFAHQQAAPAATWTVSHGLNTKPGVTVVDSAGALVLTEISYPDDNTAVVVFATPTAGTAYLRG